METTRDELSYPFVLRFTEGCGQRCHDSIMNAIHSVPGSHYSIIDKDHSLVHLTSTMMRAINDAHGYEIDDFVPVLPEMKIDSNVQIERYCSNADTIPLHIVVMPTSQEEINELSINAPSDWNMHASSTLGHTVLLGIFEDLTPSRRSRTVIIPTPCNIAESMVTYLSSQNFVQWIAIRPDIKLWTEYANGVVQSGVSAIQILREANLTGEGQIIGIADSGLDTFSCFFYDADVPTPYNAVDYTHRKVIYYHVHADATDSDGHGTLVSGTAAGKCENSAAIAVALKQQQQQQSLSVSGDLTSLGEWSEFFLRCIRCNRFVMCYMLSWKCLHAFCRTPLFHV